MTAPVSLSRARIIRQLDGTYELFPVDTGEDALRGILMDCLEEWERVRIGMLVPGAVWEIKPPQQPHTGFMDGYLTVDFGEWHLHLCIGVQASAPPGTARLRRTARAELYRRLNRELQPTSWGFRMFNGGGQQQITVLLPNPHLDDDQSYADCPDWDRLYLWDRLREKYLGLGSDPLDRSAPRFYHG